MPTRSFPPSRHVRAERSLPFHELYCFPAQSLAYFQHFGPIDRVGYSIYIDRIESKECNRVREQLGLPPIAKSINACPARRQRRQAPWLTRIASIPVRLPEGVGDVVGGGGPAAAVA